MATDMDIVRVYVKPETKAAMEKRAAADGLSLSAWLRSRMQTWVRNWEAEGR